MTHRSNEDELTTRHENQQALNLNQNTQHSTVDSLNPEVYSESRSPTRVHKRVKRLHVFRPLFVYRQEKIERQRILDERKFRTQKINNRKINNEIQRRKESNPCCDCDSCDKCRQF